MVWAWIYDYVVFNEDKEQFLDSVRAIIESELLLDERGQENAGPAARNGSLR